eukprot:SAG31_NODE_6004_length_2218_cov_1.061350_2_plen_287_part_01
MAAQTVAPPAQEAYTPSPEEVHEYGLDVGGFIIVRQHLRPAQVAAAKACIGGGGDSTGGLRELLVEQCGPFQSLLRRFSFVGSSFGKQGMVLEAGPSLLPQLGPATATEPNSSSLSPAAGGADQLLHDYIVHPSGEMAFAQGLAAYWALADCPAGAGGLVLLPGSHRAFVAAPPAVLDRGAADDLLLQPVLRAGDLGACCNPAAPGQQQTHSSCSARHSSRPLPASPTPPRLRGTHSTRRRRPYQSGPPDSLRPSSPHLGGTALGVHSGRMGSKPGLEHRRSHRFTR